ncbi:putative toxin-antitoxin system toxin component, PIN family [Desulfoferrobacter suflitae]|uniref:putative toxin-antitoxin system toxin component, PIN family n=1 Tax=Desulfoferrobacter suflitae TaxID=2865782 RepID=UPI00216413A0|nr:putative toxin-antitoxin system toxin component, PIN family [Desulfoferrobacter suflitae]MCK8600697.1 putative toxin-antitoxin system toxin component, PIN family [Desulfoferrobacter suflitae]
MTSNARFVPDTGVLVSAVVLPRSIPRQAVDPAFAQGIVLVSTDTIDELDEVLRRPKFNRYLREEERLLFLAAFIRDAKVIDITEKLTECRDPKDNKFLELAISGNAACIVSGDSDLLVLNPFRGVAILTPQEFISRFK